MGETGPERCFRILFVCTGNVCRSAYAEVLTTHLLTGRLGPEMTRFVIASAGTQAMVGRPIHPETRSELGPWQADGPGADRFVARQLESDLVGWADLVLAATPEHRAAVLTMSPEALSKTYSLREFARLAAAVDPDALPGDPVERAQALVGRARSKRGTVRAKNPADDAVADPMGRGRKAQQVAAAQIAEAVQTITSIIAAGSGAATA